MTAVVIVLLVIGLAVCAIGWLIAKVGLFAYIAWTVTHGYEQPTKQELESIIRWCAQEYMKDILKKS